MNKKKSKKQIPNYATIFNKLINDAPKTKSDKIYLKYKDDYLTWRFAGNDTQNNSVYKLILLSYKNKQNEFKLHTNDYFYLKQIYEKHNLYNHTMQNQLNNLIYVSSLYNINKDQFLELIPIEDNKLIIKASVWYKKGPAAYLYINDKNKLYFDSGIHSDIAKFTVEN